MRDMKQALVGPIYKYSNDTNIIPNNPSTCKHKEALISMYVSSLLAAVVDVCMRNRLLSPFNIKEATDVNGGPAASSKRIQILSLPIFMLCSFCFLYPSPLLYQSVPWSQDAANER